MDIYSKKFIRASVIYLAIGVFFGLHMSITDHAVDQVRFVHIHLLLLGFMAMMIYGVAYHILPRFNASPVPWPALIPAHFWLANIGLIGMVTLFALGAYWSTSGLRYVFAFFGAVEVTSIFFFVFNILAVLRDKPEIDEHLPQAPEGPDNIDTTDDQPKIKIDPSMKIAEILDTWPHLEETLNKFGMAGLTSEAVRQSAARVVTLKMAVTKAKADLGEVLAAMEGGKILTTDSKQEAPSHPDHFLPIGKQINRGERATPDTQIGRLLAVYPETRDIFSRRYGEACFTCPGQKTETVEQTAQMHGAPVEDIMEEINLTIDKALNN